MKKLYLSLWVVVIGLLFTSIVFADHNSHLEGYSDQRGYNMTSCHSLQSSTTGKPAEWLGHLVGCLIEENEGGVLSYVLVMEYRVEKLSKEHGDKLRQLVKEYTKSNGVEM